MAFPDVARLLDRFGFSAKSDGGYQLKVSANGNCVFIFAWNVQSYRLWWSLFLIECTDIDLWYVSICKASALGLGVSKPGGGQAEGEGEEESGASGGTASSSTGSTDEVWVVTYNRKASETTCEFGAAEDIQHTDLQNLFNSKMGLALPNPPTPN